MSIAKDIIQGWNQRQTKTVLPEKMIKTFGKIHSNNDPEIHHKKMLDLLREFIDSLPSSQSDYFDSNSCFEGFLNWNASWKKFYSRYSHRLSIEIVHTAYESWCIETKGNHTEFKELWENCMIRSFSHSTGVCLFVYFYLFFVLLFWLFVLLTLWEGLFLVLKVSNSFCCKLSLFC